MTNVDNKHSTGIIAIALVLSASLHLAVLAIYDEQPATTAAHSGQYGLSLQLVTAHLPAAEPVHTSPPATSATTTQEREIPATTTLIPARNKTTPSEKDNETLATAQPKASATPLAGTQTALQQIDLSTALHTQIRHAMQPYFNYPLLARRRGWQGTVRVGLRIMANGHISRLRIVQASHYRLLDQAALDSLGNIRSIPEAVAWLGGRHSDIVLPVEYRLTDS